eukprot:CAMPEP_0197710128 /NCGR_PEP_ID=MMETSP1338-20131121/128799_1 /TAXON_ID=43686 ORGANISM="Pelagodinium beii, Strain RCC1491" /NCGR_SAMPLE_ID=MMETSP1338 /ASSEMBLY_ACC=CAM_ASM_000754 /LENGTH=60 /DNA_ID=CAMNT_0043294061 /DNA_START=38 /DNA_END=220 /DNA_ORIENTATION=+
MAEQGDMSSESGSSATAEMENWSGLPPLHTATSVAVTVLSAARPLPTLSVQAAVPAQPPA